MPARSLVARATVKINSLLYALARTEEGKEIYATKGRTVEGVPSDYFDIRMNDWSGGVGHSYAHATGFITTLPGRLIRGPEETTFAVTHAGDFVAYIEEKSATNVHHGLIVTTKEIIKITIGATPALVEVYDLNHAALSVGSKLIATDVIGHPVRAVESGTAYLYFPINDDLDVLRMTLPITDGPTDDAFTRETNLGDAADPGASWFTQLPNGDIVRATAGLDAGTFENRSQVAILVSGEGMQTGTWGQGFPVGGQTSHIVSLLAYGELIVVRKEEGWFAAFRNSNQTLRWDNIIPEASAFPRADNIGDERPRHGAQWGGDMFLMLPGGMWRHSIYNTDVRGPEQIDINHGDSLASGDPFGSINHGLFTGIIGAQSQMYGVYSHDWDDATSKFLRSNIMLARRQTRSAGDGELEWHSLKALTKEYIGGPWVTRNSPIPYLMYSDPAGNLVRWFGLAKNQRDWGGMGGTIKYGGDAANLTTNRITFPSQAQLISGHFTFVGNVSTDVWRLKVYRDSASTPETVPGQLNATGFLYWAPRTNDTCRSMQLVIDCTGASDATPMILTDFVLHGRYIPEPGDELLMAIDIKRTAGMQRKTEKAVRDTLRGHRDDGALAFVDVRGESGEIGISEVADGAPEAGGGLQQEALMTVHGQVLDYS